MSDDIGETSQIPELVRDVFNIEQELQSKIVHFPIYGGTYITRNKWNLRIDTYTFENSPQVTLQYIASILPEYQKYGQGEWIM